MVKYGQALKNQVKVKNVTQEIFFSLILPAHNEQERLPGCIEKVAAFVSTFKYPIEVLIVENASSDKTFEMAESYAEKYEWLRAIKDDQRGKGRAVRTGMLAARGRIRFFADVDFSMPIDEIYNFLPPRMTDRFDVAIGSREAEGAVRYDEPELRHFTGRVFNWVVRILAVHGLKDTQCGFKCFTAEAAEKLFSRQKIDGWAFDAEVLFIAQQLGLRIIEVPVQWYYDGSSKIHIWSDAIKMIRELVQIRINAWKGLYK